MDAVELEMAGHSRQLSVSKKKPKKEEIPDADITPL